MNGKEMIEVAEDIEIETWGELRDKMDDWLYKKFARWEKKTGLTVQQSNKLNDIECEVGMAFFGRGYVAGKMCDITDPDLLKRIEDFKKELIKTGNIKMPPSKEASIIPQKGSKRVHKAI